MTQIEAMLQSALLQREGEFGAFITIGGNPYPCSPSTLSNAKKLGAGGNSLFDDLIVVVRSELFTGGLPTEQTDVDYHCSPSADAREMKVESVVIPPGSNYVQLHLNARYQGA